MNNQDMNKEIRKIYSRLIQDTECKDVISKGIYEEIMKLTEEERRKMDWKEYEQYRDKLFQIAFMAEESGFVKGFKYATLLMAEAFTGNDEIIVKP